MCDSTEHAGCELGQLRFDFPAWTIREVPAEDGSPVAAVEAVRNGASYKVAGEDRFGSLRRLLVRHQAAE
ncbi:MAG TPA: hypothetical protein VF506_18420 [Streptosporangiaceae bacterium]